MKKLKIPIKLDFLIISIFSIFVISLKLNIIKHVGQTNVFENDALWFQTTYQQLMQDGLFKSSESIAYPFGFTFLTYQTIGGLLTIFPIIFSLIGIHSSALAINIALIIGIFINAIAVRKLASLFIKSRINLNVVTLLFFLTPYSISKLQHIPPAHYYLIPATIYLIISLAQKRITYVNFFVILVILSVLSPQWWVTVMIYILIFYISIILVISKIDKKVNEDSLKYTLFALIALFSSIIFSFFVKSKVKHFIGFEERQPWQSNVFGGKFADLITGSPTLNRLIPQLINVEEGASFESNITKIGFPLILGSVFLFILIFSLPIMVIPFGQAKERFLLFIGITSIFMFLTGGLGNLQASIFVFLGSSSPARSWSRLSILIAMFGLIFMFIFIEQKMYRLKLTSTFISLLFIFQLFEVYNSRVEPWQESHEVDIFKPIQIIKAKYKNCGVLQLPLDRWPVPLDFKNVGNGAFYFKGYQAFIIEPEMKWSFGNWEGSKPFKKIAEIPIVLDGNKKQPKIMKSFCTILFDKKFADWLGRENSPTSGSVIINYPVLYSDQRFTVFKITKYKG